MKLVASDALSLTATRVSDDVCLCDHHFTVSQRHSLRFCQHGNVLNECNSQFSWTLLGHVWSSVLSGHLAIE